MASSSQGKVLKKADPSTIHNKFMVGYQGWFTCPGDGKPLDPHHHGWLHWFTYPIPDGGRPNTDLWPDVSEYSPSELFPAPGLKYANGEQAFLFSSRNARTVEKHFHWMALHGVDGAFLQRFLGQCDLEQGNQAIRDQRDEVGDHVRRAAELEGRTYAIMYDISGVAPDRIEHIIKQDWVHLIRTKGILDSPNYLREKGKAVVTLWGFGMNDNNHDPNMVRAVTRFIRENTPGGAYIMGGSPAYWRTSESDADRNPEWVNVWLEEFDAISPWTIGRYHDLEGADRFSEWNVKGDLELIRKRNEEATQGVPNRRHIDYIPVVFPGGSGFNLSEGKWNWNDAPRLGGRFLWRELWNLRRQGVRTIYGAMWDEYDEGTAFLPVVSKKRQLPVHEKYGFMALDEDGYDLPPDWYMRIAGFAGESLRGERFIQETFPSKELEDYWSTRPRYEEPSSEKASGSGEGSSLEKWEKWEKEKEDIPPPPPYTLEADNNPAEPSVRRETKPPTSPVPLVPPVETRPVESRAEVSPNIEPAPIRMDTRPLSPPGALNASPNRPSIPLSSRPSASYHSPSSSLSANGPPVPLSSRPHAPGDSISSLSDDLRRQNLSSSSATSSQYDGPLVQPPQGHPTSRPISPLSRPGTTPNDHAGQYQPPSGPPPSGYQPPTGPPSQSTYPQGSSPNFPTPGLPRPSEPSSPTGPWSQAAWPPPEWGRKPTPDQSSFFPTADYSNSSYQPGYLGTSTPALPPRPLSPGGFSFPQANAYSGTTYGPPPGQSSYPPYPGSNQYDAPYAVYRPGGGYPPSTSSYPGGPQAHSVAAPPGPSAPPRPPSHPSSYNRPPQQSYSNSNSGSASLLGGLGGSKISGLAQTGLSTGEKLFNKFTGKK